jgi:hypothetical protein
MIWEGIFIVGVMIGGPLLWLFILAAVTPPYYYDPWNRPPDEEEPSH